MIPVRKHIISLFLLLPTIGAVMLLPACSLDRRLSADLSRQLKQSATFSNHYTGLVIYDLENQKALFSQNGDKYFTPASNTKLFTFYAALKILGPSIPALRYIEKGDSLIFWGTGDPAFLQSRLKDQTAWRFLRERNRQLFFASGRYTGSFYGRGWQWDDYNDYYQAEITELPLLDNLVRVRADQNQLKVIPGRFRDSLVRISGPAGGKDFNIIRDFNRNIFRYPAGDIPDRYEQELPYRTSTATTLAILADTLGKPVMQAGLAMPAGAKTLYGASRDSVLKEMMLPSDNFIAEQLLLVCADQLGRQETTGAQQAGKSGWATLSAEKTISYISSHYLQSLPDKPVWIDGSGLSRYNLFTPRSIIRLLELIREEIPEQQQLFRLLPAGGKTGTLKNAYPGTDKPYVFGKTGSFSNNYNQSGYLITKKGRLLAFAFMNNNFTSPTAEVRTAIAKLISSIHEKY